MYFDTVGGGTRKIADVTAVGNAEIVYIVGDFEVFNDFVVDVDARLPGIVLGSEAFPSDSVGTAGGGTLTVNDAVQETLVLSFTLPHVDVQTSFVAESEVAAKMGAGVFAFGSGFLVGDLGYGVLRPDMHALGLGDFDLHVGIRLRFCRDFGNPFG